MIPILMADKTSSKSAGHREHTKSADEHLLAGEIHRPIKITMVGAGSMFTPRLMADLFSIPGNKGGIIALVDIDRGRLRTMHRLVQSLAEKRGGGPWKIIASDDRRKVLKGSDYVVNCIEVSGLECVRFDNDIPARYGIDQCIGDTIGPGGLFKALRTIPVWLESIERRRGARAARNRFELHQPHGHALPGRGAIIGPAGGGPLSFRPGHDASPRETGGRAAGANRLGMRGDQPSGVDHQVPPRRTRPLSRAHEKSPGRFGRKAYRSG